MSAPAAMASAVLAAVPSSRSSGGAPPVSSPRNRLRLVPTSSGRLPSARLSSPSRCSSSRFEAVPFPKPIPGSTMIRSGEHSRGLGGGDRLRQPGDDGVEHPVRVLVALLVVHDDQVRAGVCRGRGSAGVTAARPHVVHDPRAGGERGPRYVALRGVDAHDRPITQLGHEPADDGDGERGLGGGADRIVLAVGVPRPAGLRADVEDLGAGRRRTPAPGRGRPRRPARPSSSGLGKPVAGERVGRQVQDPHQPRPLAPRQPPGDVGRCHHASSAMPVIMPRMAPTR